MKAARALLLVACAMAAIWIAAPFAASAHALLQSSDPAAGASLGASPAQVTITFGETPDPKLSSIRVLDSSGTAVQNGPTQTVAGQPAQLTVALPALPPGVYTVTWRTVSSVDGHLATGSFAFGVGVAPPRADTSNASASGSSQLSPLGIAGRWLLYAGLIVLLGACWMLGRGLRAAAEETVVTDRAALRTLVIVAGVAAALGTALVIGDQLAASGIALTDIAGTSLATALALRGLPLVVGALALWLVVRGRAGWPAALFLAGATVSTMLADVALSHAAAAGQPLIDGSIQLVHFLAAGAWLGGLAALLVWLRHRPADTSALAVARRFSAVATVSIAVLVATGILRAIAEIGTVDALFSSDFGRLVIVKSALLVVLALLGALNHFRNLPRGVPGIAALRRIGPAELAVAVVVVLVSAALVNVAPPSESAAAAAAQQVTVSGSDFATTTKATLTVTPGVAGFDAFVVDVRDFDSGARATPDSVTLRFALPARPDIGGSRLDLAPQPDGTFSASGSNLSIDGTWRVTAVVTRGSSAAEVPFDVTTRIVRQPVDVSTQPGLPTIYTVHLDAGRTVQVYLDPGTAGQNDVHATFFDSAGQELPVASATMTIGPEGQTPQSITPQILEPGHFVGQTTLDPGTYLLTVAGPAPDGSGPLIVRVDVEVTQ